MGLAASQGRLLLLTARKSDLEFRAQQISQSRLILAREQEGVAKKYADAVSNTCFKFTVNVVTGTGANAGTKTEETDFTVANFFKYKDDYKNYRLVGPNGTEIKFSGGKITNASAAGLNAAQKSGLENDAGGAESALKFFIETGVIKLQKIKEGITANADGSYPPTGADGKSSWEDATIAGETKFRETLDDRDDKLAETAYNADMLRIKVKDQQLELDLKGIETQHKAVETEYESVQKVIQKNIEVSFKIFS